MNLNLKEDHLKKNLHNPAYLSLSVLHCFSDSITDQCQNSRSRYIDTHCIYLLDEVDSLLAQRADFSNRRFEQFAMAVRLPHSQVSIR